MILPQLNILKLAASSEAYWEFRQEFFDVFKKEYSLTEKYIENNILMP